MQKTNIAFVFSTKSYFAFPKNIRLSSTYYFSTKIPNKSELQQIAFDFQDSMNLYKTIFFFGYRYYSSIK